MALKGNLKDFSVTQLLNLIHLARKTGALTIHVPAGRTEMFFREGKLVYASTSEQDGHLASILSRAGKLTPEQEEIKRLKAENKRLEMERDILKKATAFFAAETT